MAVRDAARFDRGAASPRAGLLAAIPVVAVQDDRPRPPLPELQPLAADTDAVLSKVEAALRARPDEQPPGPALPDLRARYLTFADLAPAGARREGLLAELDEIVDAANSLASVADLDGSSASEAGRTQAQDASVIHS